MIMTRQHVFALAHKQLNWPGVPLTLLATGPSFGLIWVGSGARDGLAKLGYLSCEDVCARAPHGPPLL